MLVLLLIFSAVLFILEKCKLHHSMLVSLSQKRINSGMGLRHPNTLS